MNDKIIDNITLFSMFDGAIRCGRPQLFEILWKIVDHLHNTNNRLYKIMDINCYCMAIKASSESNEMKRLQFFIDHFKQNNKIIDDKIWGQILIGYARMNKFDQMWNEYNCMKNDYNIIPDSLILNILSSWEQRKEYKLLALTESKKYIRNWDEIDHNQIRGFYRAACNCDDKELEELLLPIVNKMHQYEKVCAIGYDLNTNTKYEFNNSYSEEEKEKETENKDILKITDKLIQSCNHFVDINIIPETPNNRANLSLSYHAEKKALAHLLMNVKTKNFRIDVNLRMCKDCHKLFCLASKIHQVTIECNDPNKRHIFTNGECSCKSY